MQFSHKLEIKRPLTILLGGMILMALVLGLGEFSLAHLGKAEKVLLLMLGASATFAVLGFRNWRPYAA